MRKIADFLLLFASVVIFVFTAATNIYAAPGTSCKEDNFDVDVIVGAIEHGVEKPYVLAKAKESADGGYITAERFESIQKLVEDAYRYPPEFADTWGEQHKKRCDDA